MPVEERDIPHRGRVHVVRGTMTPDDEVRLKAESCRRLLLNEMDEAARNGLAFLERLPELEELHLSDLLVEDVAGVHHLHNLRVLTLNSYDTTQINFGCLPRLEECFSFWRPGIDSLFSSPSLQKLEIQRYRYEDLTPLGGLSSLQSLKLVDPRIKSLRGMEHLQALSSLVIVGARRLDDFEALAAATELEELELSQCRLLTDVGMVGAMHRLRRLGLSDCKRLKSIEPLRHCVGLEEVELAGSTDLADGELRFLAELPRLHTARIAKRSHYNPSADDIQRMIADRRPQPS